MKYMCLSSFFAVNVIVMNCWYHQCWYTSSIDSHTVLSKHCHVCLQTSDLAQQQKLK